MRLVGIKVARKILRNLIEQASLVAKFTITRPEQPVAMVITPPNFCKPLPEMRKFRQGIGRIGTPAAQLIREERSEIARKSKLTRTCAEVLPTGNKYNYNVYRTS